MNIIVSKHIGFCSGVNRCVKITENLLKEKKTIYALGDLLHNNEEMKRLCLLGLRVCNSIHDLPKEYATVIIRTHGIEKDLYSKISHLKLDLVDGTCPIVKKSQKLIIEYSKQGYDVIIFGDIEHPEIKALVSYVENGAKKYVVDSLEKLKEIEFGKNKKIILISQTTKKLEDFKSIQNYLTEKIKNLKIFNTICKETIYREKEASDIAKKSQIVIVVGGKESANTLKLVKIALKENKNVFHINNTEELKKIENLRNYNKIGLISGASTPNWLVEDIMQRIGGINYAKD